MDHSSFYLDSRIVSKSIKGDKDPMAKRLKGRVALVTGASRGIGRSIAFRFAEEGALVAVNYRKNREMAEEVCKAIKELGGEAVAIQGDVGDLDAIPDFVKRVWEHFEVIDILVNNAGIYLETSLADPKMGDMERLMQVNVHGLVRLSAEVIPGMIERRYGKILNLASIAGLGTSIEGSSGYGTTKAAVILITKRTAFELGRYNINVNAIAPGLIRTDMGMPEKDPTEIKAKIQGYGKNSVLGRIGEPDEIAHAALFLASDESAFITGQVLVVDRGRTNYLSHSV